MNTQFNIFHAVVWSIGFHIFCVNFFPVLNIATPVKVEKVNEKVRLIIAKKNESKFLKPKPVTMLPVSPQSRKYFVEPKVSLIPVKVNLDQPINAATITNSSMIPEDIKNITPISSTTATNRKILTANLNQNKINFLTTVFQPKLSTTVPEKGFSDSAEVTIRTEQTKYYASSYTPKLRKVEKIINHKQEPKIDYEKLWSDYSYSIRMKVASAQVYPEFAREKNKQGKAILSIKLGRNGNILNVSVGNSSGHEVLDEAAVKAIKDAAPYPKIPDKLNRQYVLLKLPISFVIN
jgi:protein TonB